MLRPLCASSATSPGVFLGTEGAQRLAVTLQGNVGGVHLAARDFWGCPHAPVRCRGGQPDACQLLLSPGAARRLWGQSHPSAASLFTRCFHCRRRSGAGGTLLRCHGSRAPRGGPRGPRPGWVLLRSAGRFSQCPQRAASAGSAPPPAHCSPVPRAPPTPVISGSGVPVCLGHRPAPPSSMRLLPGRPLCLRGLRSLPAENEGSER